MVVGIGIDIIEIKRIEKAAEKAAFLRKVFTDGEVFLYHERHDNPAVLAGCFAAKEAIVKAFGTGFKNFQASDVEVLRGQNGEPVAVLRGKALELSQGLGIESIFVSITNTAEYAAAVAVLEKPVSTTHRP